MPIKILLADKSITIQKVVEMLFSGKEYEVLCVSDGETALGEAQRVMPDVVLADVDLPRIDGYSFAARLKQEAALARTPVILMMSRDDVFDAKKASQASIIDHIAKPFESQELIGKVRKAVSAASLLAEPAAAARPVSSVQPQKSPAAPMAPPTPVVSTKPATGPKQAPPANIFDIIREAPTHADLKRTSPPPAEEEIVFEVEPVVEIEEPMASEVEHALPVGEKAMQEMRAGLGLSGKDEQAQPEIVNFESLDMATSAADEYRPQQAPTRRPMPDSFAPREYIPPPPGAAAPASAMSEEKLRSIAEETISRVAREYFKSTSPVQSPKVSEDTVRRGIEEAVSKIAREIAREVIEKVAWEVIPDLAEMLIKAEIERLKVET